MIAPTACILLAGPIQSHHELRWFFAGEPVPTGYAVALGAASATKRRSAANTKLQPEPRKET